MGKRFGASSSRIKIRRCSECESVRLRGPGKCRLSKPLLGMRCSGRMRIVRYPTPEEMAEVERVRCLPQFKQLESHKVV
mgnify:CR=1 FL=1